jgi:hypothetical protein
MMGPASRPADGAVYSIVERRMALSESQLRGLLEVSARDRGRLEWVNTAISFVSGTSLSLFLTLLTVPKESFQGIGALTSSVVYYMLLVLLGGLVVALGALYVGKKILKVRSTHSTDDIMSSYMGAAPVGSKDDSSNTAPGMVLREISSSFFENVQVARPPDIASPDKIAHKLVTDAGPVEESPRVPPIRAAEEIPKATEPKRHIPSMAISAEDREILLELKVRGYSTQSVLERAHGVGEAEAALARLIGAGYVLARHGRIVLTTLGERALG